MSEDNTANEQAAQAERERQEAADKAERERQEQEREGREGEPERAEGEAPGVGEGVPDGEYPKEGVFGYVSDEPGVQAGETEAAPES